MPENLLTQITGVGNEREVAPGILMSLPSEWKETGGKFDLYFILDGETHAEERTRVVISELTISQTVDGPPVTLDAIKGLRLDALRRRAIGMAWLDSEDFARTGGLVRKRLTVKMAERLRAAGPTDESLQWVARACRLAGVMGEHENLAVQKALGLKKARAANWILLAREKGLLGRSEGRGRAGG